MPTTPFALAQQAANEAYAMTLQETGDQAKAAADYAAVMSAYNAAQAEQQWTPRPGWFVNTTITLDQLSDAIIADMQARCDEQYIDRDTNPGMCN